MVVWNAAIWIRKILHDSLFFNLLIKLDYWGFKLTSGSIVVSLALRVCETSKLLVWIAKVGVTSSDQLIRLECTSFYSEKQQESQPTGISIFQTLIPEENIHIPVNWGWIMTFEKWRLHLKGDY